LLYFQSRSLLWGGIFDPKAKQDELEELEAASQAANFWNDADNAKSTLRRIAGIKGDLLKYSEIESLKRELETTILLLQQERDLELEQEAQILLRKLKLAISDASIRATMRGEFDREAAIVEINSGAGGVDAQDWGQMLVRMYVRWSERRGFSVEVLDWQDGEVAGVKSATLLISGEWVYGYLRGEQGVHRLVRISPFDSNARRHTSFASVTVTPDIEDSIDVVIDETELRIDTYRSSGAGGQHVNKTDSAVRITHIPTGIVVACQSERSQHKNKARAMKLLKAKLFELEQQKRSDRLEEIKGERKKIDFGSQIRSYVLQPYQMVKDLRTNVETSSVNDVLDGDIDEFIQSNLRLGIRGWEEVREL
jgi:peptide chain release factor 2